MAVAPGKKRGFAKKFIATPREGRRCL